MAAWWWTRNQAGSMGPAPRERGTVIFDNTPVASLEADLDFVPTR